MHIRHASGIGIAALALLIALLHFLATRYFWYWEFWWFDILMHFLGGFLVAASLLWWIRFEVPISIRGKVPRLAVAFATIMIAGASWEVFEYFTNSYAASNYTLDTTMDLSMNVAGMLGAYLVLHRL